MSADALEIENHVGRIKGRETRTQSIATRFTRAEEKALLKKAEASGQTLREWAREMLLRGDVVSKRDEMEIHMFTELVGIQMLLMNTLEPLLCGEKLTREQVKAHFRQVQTTKAAQAQELLTKRNQKQEK